jgi:hypothetical protein
MKKGLCFEAPGTPLTDFGPEYIIWAMKAAVVTEEPYPGNGTEVSPFCLNSIGQWAKAAAEVTAKGRDLYVIGGQIIERNPAGEYANYMTDVLEAIPVADFKEVSSAGRPRRFSSPDRSDRTPIYRKKYERIGTSGLDDVKLAQQMRELLKGAQRMDIAYSDELPGLAAAMFLAEVCRAPVMLPIGLMLLDLIEKQVRYGRDGSKIYTIEKMMSDPTKPSDRISGGKHPMMHDGTINQAKVMFQALNPVTKKTVSIATAWLDYYFKSDCTWRVTMIKDKAEYTINGSLPQKFKEFDKVLAKSKAPDKEIDKKPAGGNRMRIYLEAIRPALERRCSTLDCLL